jgi:hypothetical protein
MTESVAKPVNRAVDHTPNGSSEMLAPRLADAVAEKATAAAIYGEPVERGPVTVIPVARVRWGFGGGTGTGSGMDKIGAGGAGGMGGSIVSPVGFITIRDGDTKFYRIREQVPPWMLPPVLLAATMAGAATLITYVVVNRASDTIPVLVNKVSDTFPVLVNGVGDIFHKLRASSD